MTPKNNPGLHFSKYTVVVNYAQIPYVFTDQHEGRKPALLWEESGPHSLQTASFLTKAYVPNCEPVSLHSSVLRGIKRKWQEIQKRDRENQR